MITPPHRFKADMSGLNPETPIPTEIKLHQKTRRIEFAYEDGARYELSYEFLRVFTPSAEARGHGPGQETLQVGKRDVDILRIEAVGNYAIKPVFSDGHESGLYSWDILYSLCRNRDALWQTYLTELARQGASREPAEPAQSSNDTSTAAASCGSGKHGGASCGGGCHH